MLLVVRVERTLPARLAAAPLRIQLAQLGHAPLRRQPHAAEQRVAHEHGEASTILHHGLLRAGRGQVRGGFGSVGAGSRVLPFVDQRGVDGTNHNAQPGDDVP